MNKIPSTLWIARALIYLNAIIWVGVGLANILLYPRTPQSHWSILLFAAGMIAYGAILAATGILLGRWKYSYPLAAGLMVLTVLLFFIDDFGLNDLLAMLPALAALVFLAARRKALSAWAIPEAARIE
jgi:hypothetical protein